MEKDLIKSAKKLSEEELALMAEKVLNKSLLEYQKEKLRKEIDKSLQERNKEEFLRLTGELKRISCF
ncbi:IDEAL domain-containing protein [Bacillus dakarensis]|uniref:IDEAL domain-containing protein n=1 Tax=Robertmurraya dakarensis TaxID=1926278 RepID=UPI000981EDF9|nr:IDEAL domain-containing protein [Bacillus dakarensis]